MGNEEVSEQGKCDIRAPDSAVDERVDVQRESAKGKCGGKVRRRSTKGKCEGEMRWGSAEGKCRGEVQRGSTKEKYEGEVRRGNAKGNCEGEMRRGSAKECEGGREEDQNQFGGPTTARLSYPKGRLNMQPRCT